MTAEEKELYWKRRGMGLRGQLGYANVVQTVEMEDGTVEHIPVSYQKPLKGKRQK